MEEVVIVVSKKIQIYIIAKRIKLGVSRTAILVKSRELFLK